jgi:cytochrome c oxidase cbb3-type subunit 2
MSGDKNSIVYKINTSAILTVIGVILLFSTAIIVTLLAPAFTEKEWIKPSSEYQMQMYEIADPHVYISNQGYDKQNIQMVNHLKSGMTLQSFSERKISRIVAPKELEKYISRFGESKLLLTPRLLFLREPEKSDSFDALTAANTLRTSLQATDAKQGKDKLDYMVLELYEANKNEAFSLGTTDGILENWVDADFEIIDNENQQEYFSNKGVIYYSNPIEFRYLPYSFGKQESWKYDPSGKTIDSLDELKSEKFRFISRKELITMGENIYRAEGCWYCHTEQTRTLVQDLVLNGSESEPAPPSTPNEYVYQQVTFPGTRRIGPDMSRVGVKRPSRDWHKSHFWSPKTASAGSIMPSFKHFFDDDPRGTSRAPYGVPNYQFEAVFQYLMTKGTRITAPTEAWWLGKDPIQTKAIIEGRSQGTKR